MQNWRLYGDVPYSIWHATITSAGGPAELASPAAYAAAKPHTALALAMLGVESRWGTAFNRNIPENKNPLNLRPPVVTQEKQYMSYDSWFEGVSAWKERITDPTYKNGIYAKTTDLHSLIADAYAPKSDNNNPEEYVATIQNLFSRWGIEEKNVAIVATPCEIKIDVVTGPMVNRPAIPMPDASYVTVHEVGNMSAGADATMHRNFVHNGGGEHAVSFHFIVGYDLAYQLIYLNENSWHASDGFYGRGNRDTVAIETVQIGDFGKTLGNLAYLIAEIYRNPNRFSWRPDVPRLDDLAPALVKERTKQHNFWAPDKKNCPQLMRERGLFDDLLDAVANELGDAAPELPRYAAPVVPSWWNERSLIDLRSHRENGILYQPQGMRMTALKETGAYADPINKKSLRTRANIQAGDPVDIRYRYKHPVSGDMIGITRFGTHVYLKYFDPLVTYRYAR